MPISHLLTDSFFLPHENSKTKEESQFDHAFKNGKRPATDRHVQFERNSQLTCYNRADRNKQPGNHYSPHQHFQDAGLGLHFNDGDGSGELDLQKYYDEDASLSDYNGSIRETNSCGLWDNNFGLKTKNDNDDDSSRHPKPRNGNPVLIDTDGGIYDAWAMALALRSADPESQSQSPRNINIVGITTVNGCTTVENATRNVSKLVPSLGQDLPPIPIFKGMDSPLTNAPGTATKRPSFFGSDGYGDAPDHSPTLGPETRIQPDHAVMAIIKMAEKYKGKLAIVCLGPLTNLAMAVKLKPQIRQYVKEIFIVGGNSEGMGNMTVTSEFNFFVDPEAANVVLESFNLGPVFILPWETCVRSAAMSQSFRTNVISNLGTAEVKLLNKLEQNFLHEKVEQWIAPDAVLMSCFLNRELMRKTENYHCTVEVRGKHTRGMMVVDKNFIGQRPANVTLITEVNRKLFGKMIIWAVGEVDDGEDDKQSYTCQDNMKIDSDYF